MMHNTTKNINVGFVMGKYCMLVVLAKFFAKLQLFRKILMSFKVFL
jgi:hypothetical protein